MKKKFILLLAMSLVIGMFINLNFYQTLSKPSIAINFASVKNASSEGGKSQVCDGEKCCPTLSCMNNTLSQPGGERTCCGKYDPISDGCKAL